MATCSLCKGKCASHMLEALPPRERTKTVDEVCPDCATWVARVRRQRVNEVPGHIKADIDARVGTAHAPLWWVRFLTALWIVSSLLSAMVFVFLWMSHGAREAWDRFEHLMQSSLED